MRCDIISSYMYQSAATFEIVKRSWTCVQPTWSSAISSTWPLPLPFITFWHYFQHTHTYRYECITVPPQRVDIICCMCVWLLSSITPFYTYVKILAHQKSPIPWSCIWHKRQRHDMRPAEASVLQYIEYRQLLLNPSDVTFCASHNVNRILYLDAHIFLRSAIMTVHNVSAIMDILGDGLGQAEWLSYCGVTFWYTVLTPEERRYGDQLAEMWGGLGMNVL